MADTHTLTSLLDHPLWPQVRPYMRVEVYGRDGGPQRPRHRLEVNDPGPVLRARFAAIAVDCVACGAPVHPIRAREVHRANERTAHAGHLYYAPCCPLAVNVSCSRTSAARDDYLRMRRAIEGGDA